METESVVIRQEWPLQEAIPVAAAPSSDGSGIYTFGSKTDNQTNQNWVPEDGGLVDMRDFVIEGKSVYGDKFAYDDTRPDSTLVNYAGRVSGTIRVMWPEEGIFGSYPMDVLVRVLLDGGLVAAQSFKADSTPPNPSPFSFGTDAWVNGQYGGGVGYATSGAFGPVAVDAGSRFSVVLDGMTYGTPVVQLGVMWEEGEATGPPADPDTNEEEPPSGALDISSVPTIPTLTEDQAL